MRDAPGLTAALALLLALPAAAATASPAPWPLEFGSPAHADGRVAAEGLEWALLLLPPGGNGSVGWRLDGAGSVARHASANVAGNDLPAGISHPTRSVTERSDAPGQAGSTAFGGRWASLYVVAQSIRIEAAEPTSGRLAEVRESDTPAEHLFGTPAPVGTVRVDGGDALRPGAAWAVGDRTALAPLSIVAEGLVKAEWHNATVACEGEGPCPAGGGSQEPAPAPNGVPHPRLALLDYGEVAAGAGRLEGRVSVLGWAAGGTAPTMRVDGALRLPLAEQSGPCEAGAGCPDPAGRTLLAEGDLTLAGLQPSGEPGRLRATMGGTVAGARLDEEPLRGAAVAVAAAAGVPLLAALLYALRHLVPLRQRTAETLLDHPRRRSLHALIVAEPGLTFHDILRRTGLASGAAHHHLDALVRGGLVVAKREGNRLRHFENHGRHEATWRASSALRDPRVAALHAWLAQRPSASRQQVLHQAAAWGWKAGITDHRLRRLVSYGLATVQRRGRERWFAALPPPLPVPARAPAAPPLAAAGVTAG